MSQKKKKNSTNPATQIQGENVVDEGVVQSVKIRTHDGHVTLPSTIDLPYLTYKLYVKWVTLYGELADAQRAGEKLTPEQAQGIQEVQMELIDSLLENVPAYAAQCSQFSARQQQALLTNWLGLEIKASDFESFTDPGEALGKA